MSKICLDFCWLTLLKLDENMLSSVLPLIVSPLADFFKLQRLYRGKLDKKINLL